MPEPTLHEPPGYDCPFCRLQRGVHNDHNQPADVVGVTDLAFARISPGGGPPTLVPRSWSHEPTTRTSTTSPATSAAPSGT